MILCHTQNENVYVFLFCIEITGVGNVVGTSPSSMIWMQKYLPKSVNMTEEENKLQMLQREVKDLKMELDREIQVNNDLQKEAIANRKRSDMLCSTMCILRTETEALVERLAIYLYLTTVTLIIHP
jgi:superfamily II helicase